MEFVAGFTEKLDELRLAVGRGTRVVSISGLSSVASKALVVSELRRQIERPIVVVADTNSDADQWCCDLEFFQKQSGESDTIIGLPSFETDPYSGVSPHAETEERRALALWQLSRDPLGIIVLPAKSLVTRTIPKGEIE